MDLQIFFGIAQVCRFLDYRRYASCEELVDLLGRLVTDRESLILYR